MMSERLNVFLPHMWLFENMVPQKFMLQHSFFIKNMPSLGWVYHSHFPTPPKVIWVLRRSFFVGSTFEKGEVKAPRISEK